MTQGKNPKESSPRKFPGSEDDEDDLTDRRRSREGRRWKEEVGGRGKGESSARGVERTEGNAVEKNSEVSAMNDEREGEGERNRGRKFI